MQAQRLQDLLCLQQEHVLVLEDVPRQAPARPHGAGGTMDLRVGLRGFPLARAVLERPQKRPMQVSVWDIHDQLSQFSGFEDCGGVFVRLLHGHGRNLTVTSARSASRALRSQNDQNIPQFVV